MSDGKRLSSGKNLPDGCHYPGIVVDNRVEQGGGEPERRYAVGRNRSLEAGHGRQPFGVERTDSAMQ